MKTNKTEIEFQIYHYRNLIKKLENKIKEDEALLDRITGIRRLILYGRKKEKIDFYKVKLGRCRDRLREYENSLNLLSAK